VPNARLIEANSLIELRMSPERLTGEIAAFLDEVWGPRKATRAKAKKTRARARSGSASR
jgi:hypothetical protein